MSQTAALPLFLSRVVPVVALDDARVAPALARALLEGGIDVIEITLRTPAGLAAIEAVANAVPGMAVGAGTVTRAADLYAVQSAGAGFALSPGCTPELIAAAHACRLPFVPGVATASEAMLASDAGFDLLKCFPAQVLGGVGLLKAWAGPLPHLRFCPTGGLVLADLPAYLALPQVAFVGGSWLTPAAVIAAQDWGRITELAQQACRVAQERGAAPATHAR